VDCGFWFDRISYFQEQGMTLAQLAAVDDVEIQVAKRDHEINAIVESIEELSQIFKELAVLVIDQGTILDRIDYNMEQVTKQPGAR
jgi:syntaxin 16